MKIASYNIQPILLYLPDEPVWLDRREAMDEHLLEQGITDTIHVAGIHAKKFGIIGTHPYELDKPNGGHMIGQKYVGSFLSMYVIYNVMLHHSADYFMVLEDDTRFNPDWRERLTKALDEIPKDFDFLFVGSCCAVGKGEIQVKEGSEVYRYPRTSQFPALYPMGGNCYIIAKKCLEHVISTQRDAYAHADISLALHSFPQMDVYAILPRLCEQLNNENLPQ